MVPVVPMWKGVEAVMTESEKTIMYAKKSDLAFYGGKGYMPVTILSMITITTREQREGVKSVVGTILTLRHIVSEKETYRLIPLVQGPDGKYGIPRCSIGPRESFWKTIAGQIESTLDLKHGLTKEEYLEYFAMHESKREINGFEGIESSGMRIWVGEMKSSKPLLQGSVSFFSVWKIAGHESDEPLLLRPYPFKSDDKCHEIDEHTIQAIKIACEEEYIIL